MVDKQITPQESMAIISKMIEATQHRISVPDIRISIMWGVLTIVVAATCLTLMLCGCAPWLNCIWFAIPVIGIPVNIMMARKNHPVAAKTYIDKISDSIWKSVGFIAIALSLICLGFNIAGYPQAWLSMFFYAFIIVGFGATAQGIVIREPSYAVGGLFSVLAGFVLIILTLCNVPLLVVWVLPLYIFCFLITFVVPGFVMMKKIKSQKK